MLAFNYAHKRGIPIDPYYAKWKTYGKRAGFVRNTEMLEKGKPDLVIAFPGGVGTQMMCDIAFAAGVEVLRVGPQFP